MMEFPRRHRVTFGQYLNLRLGHGPVAWLNFLIRPFGASSFAEFWRLWNPVYGYFLYYWSYRPLTRFLPRPLAMMITFAACGFLLHDVPAWAATRRALPPGATISFILFGLGAVLSERFKMDIARWPVTWRALVNVGYLAACVVAMLLVVRRI